MEFRISY